MNNISFRLFWLNAVGPFRKSKIIEVRARTVITIDGMKIPTFQICSRFDSRPSMAEIHDEVRRLHFMNVEDDELKLVTPAEGFSGVINRRVDFPEDVLLVVKSNKHYRYSKSVAPNRFVPSH